MFQKLQYASSKEEKDMKFRKELQMIYDNQSKQIDANFISVQDEETNQFKFYVQRLMGKEIDTIRYQEQQRLPFLNSKFNMNPSEIYHKR